MRHRYYVSRDLHHATTDTGVHPRARNRNARYRTRPAPACATAGAGDYHVTRHLGPSDCGPSLAMRRSRGARDRPAQQRLRDDRTGLAPTLGRAEARFLRVERGGAARPMSDLAIRPDDVFRRKPRRRPELRTWLRTVRHRRVVAVDPRPDPMTIAAILSPRYSLTGPAFATSPR